MRLLPASGLRWRRSFNCNISERRKSQERLRIAVNLGQIAWGRADRGELGRVRTSARIRMAACLWFGGTNHDPFGTLQGGRELLAAAGHQARGEG